MDVFATGGAVTLQVPLVDDSGNPLTVSAVSYRVTDEAGVELVPVTALAGFVAGSATAAITVPAEQNTLAAGVARALRNIELTLTIGGNALVRHAAYALAAPDPLVIGVNSFMTFAQATFIALAVPNLPGWDAASEQEKIAALVDARAHLCQLAYAPLTDPVAGTRTTDTIGGLWPDTGMGALTAAQLSRLPARFLEALLKAQLVEADAILGGDTIDKKRQDGLVQDNIGESRQMFRQSKPLALPVCRRALGYLAGYVTFSKRLGRQ